MRVFAIGITVLFCLNAPAMAEMFKIENPASNIYNPATRMDNPNPISPPTQPVPQQAVTEKSTKPKPATQTKEQTYPHPQPQPKHNIPHKSYHFKTATKYINEAKKAFQHEDYKRFISITEDALKRIKTGTLIASKKSKQILDKYKANGYTLIEKMKANEVKEP